MTFAEWSSYGRESWKSWCNVNIHYTSGTRRLHFRTNLRGRRCQNRQYDFTSSCVGMQCAFLFHQFQSLHQDYYAFQRHMLSCNIKSECLKLSLVFERRCEEWNFFHQCLQRFVHGECCHDGDQLLLSDHLNQDHWGDRILSAAKQVVLEILEIVVMKWWQNVEVLMTDERQIVKAWNIPENETAANFLIHGIQCVCSSSDDRSQMLRYSLTLKFSNFQLEGIIPYYTAEVFKEWNKKMLSFFWCILEGIFWKPEIILSFDASS